VHLVAKGYGLLRTYILNRDDVEEI
jgi:hypothetical protein